MKRIKPSEVAQARRFVEAPAEGPGTPFRFYAADELGNDGYPPEWHRVDLGPQGAYSFPGERWAPGIKDLVRVEAGHRCVRCLHPYRAETSSERGEWSPCDERCLHLANAGSIRTRDADHSPGWPHGWADLTRAAGAEVTIGDLVTTWPHKEFEAQWRILTVHHLDIVKANCRWWNLAALCQRCHLQIQGRVQMARVWPWEHSEWFRPYVAGYYAHVYLGEDLARPAVEARLDELLALERRVA